MVLANAGGAVVAVPTLPPRTAWGNGPGVVVTTSGGAVYPSCRDPRRLQMPVPRATWFANSRSSRMNLDRVLRYLATLNTNTVAPSGAPSSPTPPPVYLTPTGR